MLGTKNLTLLVTNFMPGDFVEVIVLMDFSYRDKDDSGIWNSKNAIFEEDI